MKKHMVHGFPLTLTIALLLIIGNAAIVSAQDSIGRPVLFTRNAGRASLSRSLRGSLPIPKLPNGVDTRQGIGQSLIYLPRHKGAGEQARSPAADGQVPIAKSRPWRFGIGGGPFYSTLGDWHTRKEPWEAEYSFNTFPGWYLFLQYCYFIDQRGNKGDSLSPRDKPGYLGYLGIRLEYCSISSPGVNTSDQKPSGLHDQVSQSDLSGYLMILSLCGEGGRFHGGNVGLGLAFASLRAEKTDLTKDRFITTVKTATGFGFTFGGGYSLIINRHLFWKVIGVDYCLIFNCDLELPNFGSNLGVAVLGTKATVTL